MPEPFSLVTRWLTVGQVSHQAASGTAEHPEVASYSRLSAKGGTELAWASDGPEPQGKEKSHCLQAPHWALHQLLWLC